MPIDDPSTWAQSLGLLKTAFDSFRSAIGMVKDVQSLGGGTKEQQKVIDNALNAAISTTALAEAEIAKAFGYELCKCEFPPTPMKTVGYMTTNHGNHQIGGPVYECPKCGYNTAAPFGYQRIAPDRVKTS
jgi:hypothetical protein